MLSILLPIWASFGEKKSNKFWLLPDNLVKLDRSVYSLYSNSFPPIPQSPKSTPGMWGLTGMAIAILPPNNNEQPTTASRLGGFVSIQLSIVNQP